MNIMRTLMVLLASIMLAACGTGINFSALRNCEHSGMAHYDSIPLASRSEHEQAQRFTPLNQGNCLLYVVRKDDWYTGASVLKANVELTPAEPSRVVITTTTFVGNVYAMWELPPGTYSLKSTFTYTLRYSEFAQIELDCRPGVVRFIAVVDRGFNHRIVLEDLTEEEGRTFVQNGIRSIGILDRGVFYKDCP
jgi:hypothetical protein